MMPELRGCSLARQYPCLGQPQLSHHLSKPSDVRPDKERRRQNIRGRHPAALAYPPPARLADNYPVRPGALGDPMVALKLPGCDTNSPILVM